MIRNSNYIDRMFLSQSNEECIYINDNRIQTNALEGVRFLFKQFKRRKNGVILNDPDRFGRNTLVCLFLRAIRPLLSRPALLLCQEGSEKSWIDRFDTWSSTLIPDLALETENPYVAKMVVINTMVNLHRFCEREWSIIIVDGDNVTTPNPILKLPFRTCFKIWNTQINMKYNLDRFEEVYKWMYPREIFDKEFFTPEPGNHIDYVEKSILLDAFFEEIILGNSGLSEASMKERKEKGTGNTLTISGPNRSSATITLGNTTIRPSIAAPKETHPPPLIVGDTTITRKTVEPPTGGVRIVGDTTITPTVLAVAPKTILPSTASTAGSRIIGETTITSAKDPTKTVCDTTITATNSASLTETQISPVPTVTISRKNKDATGTKIKRSKTRIESEIATKLFESPITSVLAKLLEESQNPNVGDASTITDYCIENFNKSKNIDNGQEKLSTESSKDNTKTDKVIKIIELGDEPPVAAQASGDKLVEMDTFSFGLDTLISQVSDTDVPGKGKTDSDKKEIEPHTILTCKPIGERSAHYKLFTDNKKCTSTITSMTSARCSDSTERDEKNDTKKINAKSPLRTDETKVVDIIKINLDELNRDMRDLVTRDTPERMAKRQKTEDSSQTATCYNEIRNKFKDIENSFSDRKLNTEQVVNSLKRNNIDVKMKECEEIVKKKFKGSLLDSLF